MKTNLFLRIRSSLLVLCFTFLATTMAWGQIISQYVETNSGTSPKGIEIWNNTGATLDFSTNNLEIQQGTNGGTPTTLVTVSSGTLASGEVMVIGTSDMGTYLTNQSLTSVAYEDYTFSFNGDDALVVEYGGVVTDVFGNPGSDPGSSWDGNGVSTADQNIQLLDGITTGDTNGWTDPSLRFETVSTDPTNDLTGFGVAPELTTSPLLSVATTTLTGFVYIEGNGPSASQSFEVSGMNLDPAAGNINVAAPANFEVSLDDNTFADDVDIAYTDGEFTDETVYVRLKSGLTENTYNGDITISGGDATDVTVAVDGEVTPIPQPELLTDPTSITGLNYMDGNGPSASQQFELSGVALDNSDVTLTAPTDFEISEDDNTYSNSITLTAYDGTPTNIYVRLQSGLAEDTYSGDITISGGGITGNITVALSGAVTPFIEQYDGEGVFELVTSLAELEDGYYVIAGENDDGLMTNENTNDYFVSDSFVLDANNNVVNPDTDRVWYIEANGGGYTIYNDVTEKYVSYSGSDNDAFAVDNVESDNQRWSITVLSGSVFQFENLAITDRRLRYNNSSTRFACYNTNFGDNIHLYKYTIPTDPILTAAPLEITGLDYMVGEGPSTAQPLEVSAINMDGTDVTVSVPAAGDIELAATESGTYSDEVILPAFDGDAINVFARLKSGLPLGDYSEVININGGGATTITVNSSGQVAPDFDGMETFENFPETAPTYYSGDFIGVYGNTWNYIEARGDYQIDGETVMLRNQGGATVEASLNSSIGDGIAVFSFDYMQALSTNVNLEVYINGNLEATVTSTDEQGVVKNSGIIVLDTPQQGVFDIEFKQGDGGGQVSIDNFNWTGVTPTADFTWEDGAWSPQTPIGNATATDDILIVNGSAAFNGDVELNNLYVQNGATLEVENVLKVNGDIENNGSIVFKSTSVANTAQFDVFNGTISGNGSFTAERYFPANRAFRLIASSIDGGSIYENWQENGNYQAAIGTHITGGDLTDGFDQSGSDNPSLFTYDNTLEDQTGQAAWNAVANTNATNIDAGTPYRLFVRGDRDIDLTSNDSPANQTIIRTTGSLHTGDFSPSISAVGGNFSFIGNPYQAIVDATQLQFTGDINNNFMYVWDASVNDNGAYVTVDLSANSNDGSTSDASQFIQPGQAVFFRNNVTFSTAPSVTFTESAKATSESLTTIFNQEDTNRLNIRLYAAEDHQNEEREIDAVSMRFSETFSNEVNDFDAAKLGNIDENLALFTDNNLLAIERREIPMHEEEMQLVVVNYRSDEYVLEFLIDELPENATLSVYDEYLDTTTEITSAENTYAYSVDQSISESTNPFRFKLVFDMETFSTETAQHQELSFYPNPVNQKASLYLPNNTANYKIAVFDILGNRLNIDLPNLEESRTQLDFSTLSSGVYILKLYGEENQHQIKFIKN